MKDTDRVRIEEVDWPAVLPWLRLLRSGRWALQPGKLALSMAMIVLLFLGGSVLDRLAGRTAPPDELEAYRGAWYGEAGRAGFDQWRQAAPQRRLDALRDHLNAVPSFDGATEDIISAGDPFDAARHALDQHFLKLYQDKTQQRDTLAYEDVDYASDLAEIRLARRENLAALGAFEPVGAFDALMDFELGAFGRLVTGIVTLNWYGGDRDDGAPADDAWSAGVDLLVIGPSWWFVYHPWLAAALLAWGLAVVSVLGGALARMTAVHLTRHERIGVGSAARAAAGRWWSYLITPLAPLAVMLVMAALMAVGGFIFFNPPAWAIDIIGAALFIVAILAAVAVAAACVLTIAGAHLFYPAIAVDGMDFFDAIARAFHYVINRPWHWLFFNALALFHGALTFLAVSLFLFIVLRVVHACVGYWVFVEAGLGVNRFDVIFPPPRFGQLSYEVDYALLDWSGRIAAWVVRCWMFLAIAVPAAYAVSYYMCANTSIYLLLRRSADDVEFEQLDVGEDIMDAEASEDEVPEKVEPARTPAAGEGT